MRRSVRATPALRGSITPPGDKSISHRTAMLNALATGEAVVENVQRGADCLATLRCLRDLGAQWQWQDESTLRINGCGLGGLREPSRVLDCRNSGTTMRLLSGILAGQGFFSVLSGDSSLLSRPMRRVVDPLRQMGARISGREDDTKAPLSIRGGNLRGIRYNMPVASGQVKSAILLAGLFAEGETIVEEGTPTRDHTERMLAAMGVSVTFGEAPAITVRRPARELAPLSMRVPGDISGAAPWLVLGAAHPDAEIRIKGVGVNPTRTGVLDALALMGADVRIEEDRMWGPEPVADIVVRSSALRGALIQGDMVPRAIDELPLLALAGCLADGETVIRDAAELRTKESDRIATTARELRRLGAQLEEAPDGLRIHGPQRLRGAAVASHDDHRLAIMLAVAGALADGETSVRNADAVAVSYPWFWQDLESLSAR